MSNYGYIALYRGERTEVYAATSYEAQREAIRAFQAMPKFKRRKVTGGDVTVHLAEVDGKTVTHTPDI